jgi:hypothetical protein
MRHAARYLSETVELRDVVMATGLALVAYGLSLISTPAAFIVPGVILVWLAIPPPTTVKRSK